MLYRNKTIFQYLKNFCTFLGRKVIKWLIITIAASIGLTIVEISITIFLQIFLRIIGILQVNSSGFLMSKLNNFNMSDACILLALSGIFRIVCQYFISYGSSRILETINCNLRILTFQDILLNNKNFTPSSKTSYLISEVFPKSALFCFYLGQILSLVLQCLGIVLLMCFTSWKETMTGVLTLIIIGVVFVKSNKIVKKYAKLIPLEQEKLTAGIERVARNWLLVRMLRTQEVEYKKLETNTYAYEKHSKKTAYTSISCMSIPSLLGVISLVAIIFLSQQYWHTKNILLISFLYLFMRLIQNISSGANFFAVLISNFPQLKEAYQYFYTKKIKAFQESQVNLPNEKQKTYPINAIKLNQPIAPSISLQDVSFNYPFSDKEILKNFNFEVTSGCQLGIYGESGSGKTTLLHLISGLLVPTSGRIKIDNQEPDKYFTVKENIIGYVGPEPFLIAGTIKENLSYGKPTLLSDNECWQALSIARADDFVKNKSRGLDFLIQEDGSGFSAGQKQRLCLARALTILPNVLILDEATANLDTNTSGLIRDSIQTLKGKITTIIVSHSMEFIKYADCVIKLPFDKN